MFAKLKVAQRSTVLTLGSAEKVKADIAVKYNSHTCQHKPCVDEFKKQKMKIN